MLKEVVDISTPKFKNIWGILAVMRSFGGCQILQTHGIMGSNDPNFDLFAINKGLITTTNIPFSYLLPQLFQESFSTDNTDIDSLISYFLNPKKVGPFDISFGSSVVSAFNVKYGIRTDLYKIATNGLHINS